MTELFKDLEDKKILILGFGLEGRSTYKELRKAFPEKDLAIADEKKEIPHELKKVKGVTTFFGKDYLSRLGEFDVIIKSPGIPLLDEVVKAKKSGVEITSQTKIFFEEAKGKIIGVTGTKGKSTTSLLIYSIL